MNTATKTGLFALKTASKKVAHKTAEAAVEFTGNLQQMFYQVVNVSQKEYTV